MQTAVGGKVASSPGSGILWHCAHSRLFERCFGWLNGSGCTGALATGCLAAPAAPTPASPDGGLSPLVWVAGLVVVVGAILWYFTR